MLIEDFLSKGNLFYYSLPENYDDQGPRVVVEAMAAGLPVICDNRSGCKDRVTDETGWLCDSKEEFVEIIKNISYDELKEKGKAARQRARKEFDKEKWIDVIIEDL